MWKKAHVTVYVYISKIPCNVIISTISFQIATRPLNFAQSLGTPSISSPNYVQVKPCKLPKLKLLSSLVSQQFSKMLFN